MVWLEFAIASLIIVLAANQLAKYGDVLAVRTGLGGMFVGTLLLSAATSLPELLTGINSINQDVPDLTVGNIFGSSMFNMCMIGILDLMYRQGRILRVVAINHSLTAGLAVLLTGMSVFFIEAKIDFQIGWFGVDSLLLIGVYLYGSNLLHASNQADIPPPQPSEKDLEGVPSLQMGVFGFLAATAVLVVVTPFLVTSSIGIAEATGLSTGFVGIALVAVVTSLPEAVTTISAMRFGAYDLAVGNLFGSNVFNIFALGLMDFFYTQGSFMHDIAPTMALAGMLGLLLTAIALINNLARAERRTIFVELDAILLLVIYGLGMWFLYSRGIVG